MFGWCGTTVRLYILELSALHSSPLLYKFHAFQMEPVGMLKVVFQTLYRCSTSLTDIHM